MSGAQKYTDDDLRRAAGIQDELFADALKGINEQLSSINERIKVLPDMQNDIQELKDDMKVVKAAVTSNSRQLDDYEDRITRLETNAA